jgi:HupE/UreJ protein
VRRVAAWTAGIVLSLAGAAASAHEGSTSYLALDARASDGTVAGRYDVALIDLALALPLDADGDGRLRWDEIEAGGAAIARFVGAGLELSRGGAPCALQFGKPWLTKRLGLTYLSIDLAAACAGTGEVAVASNLFFDADAYHRVLVSLQAPSTAFAATLAPGSRTWVVPAQASAWRTAVAFVGQGIWHVWTGYDHLVFLLLLLLPAVVPSGGSGNRGRVVALDLARIVTAFTVAHSITLGLAATGAVRLPPQPIEVAIAVSLVVAGALNLAPRFARLRLPLAFGFGLVHGFGFANALAGLDVGNAAVLPVLAGFNVGVELANLGVIAAALPLLLWTGRFAWYAPRAMPAVSLVAAALGALWMVQRI